jgi:hypothetical protein
MCNDLPVERQVGMGIGIGHVIHIAQGEPNYLGSKLGHRLIQSFPVVLCETEIQYFVLVGAMLEGTTQKSQP